MVHIVCATLLLGACATTHAVEKTEKKADSTKQTARKAVAAGDSSRAKSAAETAKKYDSFVDRNNNGIDDRKENIRQKPSNPQTPTSAQPQVKKASPPAKGKDTTSAKTSSKNDTK